MIHLAIDANEANIANRVGSNVYAFHVISKLASLIKQDQNVKATVLLSQSQLSDLPKEDESWQYKVVKPSKFWTQLALPLYLYQQQNKFDLLFTPGHYAPRYCPIPYVSSVMDLGFLHYPEQFKANDLLQLKKWTAYSVKSAQKIVTISQFSQQEIINLYNKPKADILVAYPSVSLPENEATKAEVEKFLKDFALTEPYFLFVGTLQPRKNLTNLIKAYEIFCHENKVKKETQSLPKLVIAGKIGWLADSILEKYKSSPEKNRIILTDFVADKFKPALYKHALATILVGLYEGFGIPALESMYFDTLPIVSNTTSLPEVVGEAGLLVNPHQTEVIAQGLQKAWKMTAAERKNYQQKMALQQKKFSWSVSAQKIYQLLLSVASQDE
jgi:glycosyltransferase involved in cell wall biosynthesis